MRIVVASAFRNSGNTLARYCEQVKSLQRHVGVDNPVRLLGVEGDSWDHTNSQLRVLSPVPLQLIEYSHGYPPFGSTENPIRFLEMSKIGNMIFDAVTEDDDIFVFVESDLIWDADTIRTLIDLAEQRTQGFDIFAPMVHAGQTFYDTWGFRGLDGKRWESFEPYHSERKFGLTELSSAGSCLVMRGEVARNVRIVDDMCFVGWSKDALSKGYRIATHSDLKVYHPC